MNSFLHSLRNLVQVIFQLVKSRSIVCRNVIMVVPRLRYVELPHNKEQRWLKLKELYSELNGVQNAKDLTGFLQRIFEVAGNAFEELARGGDRSKDSLNSYGPRWYFEGLELFLEEIATDEESEIFLKTILPFIVTLASSIEEFAPSEGILICSQQRGMYCGHIVFTIL